MPQQFEDFRCENELSSVVAEDEVWTTSARDELSKRLDEAVRAEVVDYFKMDCPSDHASEESDPNFLQNFGVVASKQDGTKIVKAHVLKRGGLDHSFAW